MCLNFMSGLSFRDPSVVSDALVLSIIWCRNRNSPLTTVRRNFPVTWLKHGWRCRFPQVCGWPYPVPSEDSDDVPLTNNKYCRLLPLMHKKVCQSISPACRQNNAFIVVAKAVESTFIKLVAHKFLRIGWTEFTSKYVTSYYVLSMHCVIRLMYYVNCLLL